ncbi:hypothetical protein, partial [Serratia liquefaciens]|uniref:hypothetical protein n=1 Tax=Serratia liquefaciens TaxID=614 RepID=UPI001A92AEFB
ISCLSWLTAGTNINELPARWQGEKRNFIRYFTRLLRLCAVRWFFLQSMLLKPPVGVTDRW